MATSLNNNNLIFTFERVAVLNYSKQLDVNCHTSLCTLHISFSISDSRQRKLKFQPERLAKGENNVKSHNGNSSFFFLSCVAVACSNFFSLSFKQQGK